MPEVWRPIPGHEGLYEVSSLGRVRSLYFTPPRPCRLGRDETGYPTIMLSKDGKRRPFTLHRLVCRAFHGEQPNPLHSEVAHLDGDKDNAGAANLRWVSKVENESHKRRHGTRQCGERAPWAKITDAQARSVKRLLSEGVGVTAAGRRSGVPYWTAYDIARGRAWREA